MILTLYYTESAANVINKNLGYGVDFVISLPRLDNESQFNIKLLSTTNLSNFNYCYIQGLDKYYFIDGVIRANNHWELRLRIDVLESYKSSFLTGDFLFRAKKNTLNGAIELDSTGMNEYEDLISTIELERGDNTILSVLRWD